MLRHRLHAVAAFITTLCVCPGLPSSAAQHKDSKPPEQAGAPVQIQVKNVNFRLAPDIVLEIRSLRGQLQRTREDVPVTFDDPGSFVVDVDAAQVAITPGSLTALMNSYVLAYAGAPIRNIVVTLEGNRVIAKGTVHKGVDLPFEIQGSLSATIDGDIRIHADKIKSAHIPVKGLLHLFGEDLSKLVNAKSERGMKITGDDITLSPKTLTPPPHLHGRVVRVAIVNGEIVQFFDSGRRTSPLAIPLRRAAYMYYRGGTLRFGKLTMSDADLEIVGDRPGSFDFFEREYQRQLVAGYSQNTQSGGLIAHMLDYSHFRARDALVSRRLQPPQRPPIRHE